MPDEQLGRRIINFMHKHDEELKKFLRPHHAMHLHLVGSRRRVVVWRATGPEDCLGGTIFTTSTTTMMTKARELLAPTAFLGPKDEEWA
jgi:hypothetical protein